MADKRRRRGQSASAADTTPPAPLWSLMLITAGALVMIGTYLWVFFARPATLGQDLGATTLGVMAGYLVAAVLMTIGSLPRVPRSILTLIPAAIAINIATGQIIGTLTPIPLYLDSIGTVIIGVIAGPAAGALTGVFTNVVWGLTINPTVIAFSGGAAFIGAATGWAARLGVFRYIWLAVLAGGVIGVPAGALAAPVAAFIFGGGVGVGTGSVVAVLQGVGWEMFQATTAQAIFSDVADKAIIFAIVYAVVRSLPRRIYRRYPFTQFSRLGVRPATPR